MNKKNIALLLFSMVTCISIMEIAARIFHGIPEPVINDFSLSRSDYYKKDAELIFVPRKNMKGHHDKLGSFSTVFQTNSRGLRDREYLLSKSEGVKRIVVVGDSFTWGFGVNDNEIYTERLETLLQDTEVINLGVTAYQIPQEILYFKREGMLYNPDILIVGLCLNDLIHGKVRPEHTKSGSHKQVGFRTENLAQPSIDKPDSLGLRNYIKKYLVDKSAFLTFISERINTSRTLVKFLAYIGLKELTGFEDLDSNVIPALKTYPDYVNKCWDETKEELLHFKRLASNAGVRLLVAVVPSVQSVQDVSFRQTISHSIFEEEDFDLDKPYRMLKEFASANDMEMVIPIKAFREQHMKGQFLYLAKDMHFNPAGHDLFAREIADFMIKNKF